MSLIKSSNNACALSAISVIRQDIPEEKIFKVFTDNGYNPERGTKTYAIARSMDQLGIQYIDYEQDLRRTRMKTGKFPTTAEFARGLGSKGVWYVCTMRHAFNIVDGVPVDPYYKKPQLRGRVVFAWRIHNPVIKGYLPVEEQLEAIKQDDTQLELLVSAGAKQRGSNRQRLYNLLTIEYGFGEKATPLTVAQAKRVGYSRTDIAWDIKKGHIKVVR